MKKKKSSSIDEDPFGEENWTDIPDDEEESSFLTFLKKVFSGRSYDGGPN